MPTPLETVRTYYALIDAGDLDGAFDLFDENATVRFGDKDPIVGRAAITAHVKNMVLPVAKEIEHRVVSGYEVRTGDTTTVICEAVVTYTMLHSGNVHPHNAVTISEVNADGHIVRQRNVGNLGPVIADHKAHAPN
ncbi:nuclear transport factor 2 family protein [Streptomyces sp. NPDC052693]|uniref:nuclear transport factor 2 family protein n=1 Tax=Streptomyces sp. NPDC052693 TaxID=3155814 RepID=UPI0034156C0D